MAEVTRSTRIAVKAESTEGTLIVPASGADYLPVREGFAVALAFEALESDELKGSIGQSQSTVGFENPTATLPLYLKHSGVEGQAPSAGVNALYKAAFGSVSVNATEYDTVAGSTTTVINVDTGEGANFSVGEAVLVKHASNPWEIRVIKSISSDALTLNFALDNAPASGTNLGKAIFYNVADTGHDSLSLHDYRGNGGAYQAAAGMRPVSLVVDGSAGEFITTEFSMEGLVGYYDPITLASSDTKLDFVETGPTTRAATITAGIYKTPHDLARAIESAMNLVATDAITFVYSDITGKFTIATAGSLLSLLWNTGANAANTIGDKIGFSTAADDTGSLTYTSDNAQSWAAPHTPSFDNTGNLVAKNNRIMIGSQTDNVCFSTRQVTYTLNTPKANVDSLCASSGRSGSQIASREVLVSIVANLQKHEARMFDAMAFGRGLSFQWAFGEKSGGNWVAGKSGALHLKDCSVEANELGDTDGLVTVQIEVRGFVDANSNPETGMNLL